MPRLNFGVQKLVDQWVNLNKEVNKDNSIHLDKSQRKGFSSTLKKKPTRKQYDDSSVISALTTSTATTASTVFSSSTLGSASHSQYRNYGRTDVKHTKRDTNTDDKKVHCKTQSKRTPNRVRKSDSNGKGFYPVISSRDLTFKEKLKHGTFGASYGGSWDNKSVAIKISSPTSITEEWNNEVLKLVQLTGNDTFQHENIVRLWGWSMLSPVDSNGVVGDKMCCLITDFCDGLDLQDALRFKKDCETGNFHAFEWKVMHGIANGMTFLHSHGICHGDLKPGNVLLSGNIQQGNFQVKIVDYGLTQLLKKKTCDETTQRLHKFYLAPEYTVKDDCALPADVFSFAKLTWQLVSCLEPPLSSHDNDDPLPLSFPPNTPSALVDLIEQCWHINPHQRPSFASILNLLETQPDWCNNLNWGEHKISLEAQDPLAEIDQDEENSDDVSCNMRYTKEKMSKLSMDDNESKDTKSVSSSSFFSKKHKLLRRRNDATNKYSAKGSDNLDSKDQKRSCSLKRTKQKTRVESVPSSPALPSSRADEKATENMSINSEESGSSSELKPPQKKRLPSFKYSFQPKPQAGLAVPVGIAIEHTSICLGGPLVEPVLPGSDCVESNDSTTLSHDGNRIDIVHYNHKPQKTVLPVSHHVFKKDCERNNGEVIYNTLRRCTSDPTNWSDDNRNANDSTAGRERRFSDQNFDLKSFRTFSNKSDNVNVEFDVAGNDFALKHSKLPPTIPEDVPSNINVCKPNMHYTKVRPISSFAQSAVQAPCLVPRDHHEQQHVKALPTDGVAKRNTEMIRPSSNPERTDRSLRQNYESAARLDAAAVLFSQFSDPKTVIKKAV